MRRASIYLEHRLRTSTFSDFYLQREERESLTNLLETLGPMINHKPLRVALFGNPVLAKRIILSAPEKVEVAMVSGIPSADEQSTFYGVPAFKSITAPDRVDVGVFLDTDPISTEKQKAVVESCAGCTFVFPQNDSEWAVRKGASTR